MNTETIIAALNGAAGEGYGAACAAGRRIADDAVASLGDAFAPTLPHVAEAAGDGGAFVGFFTRVAELATGH